MADDSSLAPGRLNQVLTETSFLYGGNAAYVAQLQELDTTGVEPLAHGIEVRNVFRADVRGEALPREQALANAPKRNSTSFLVPAVLD